MRFRTFVKAGAAVAGAGGLFIAGTGTFFYMNDEVPPSIGSYNINGLQPNEMPRLLPADGFSNKICPAEIPDCTNETALAYSGPAEYLPLDDKPIAPVVFTALTAREDKNFFERRDAIDAQALLKALGHNIFSVVKVSLGMAGSVKTRGGSTVEMTDASMRYEGLVRFGPTFKDKQHEARVARGMENQMLQTMSLEEAKTAIARDYLDRADYAPNIRGIVVASDKLFGTAPENLNIPQAALLVALPRAPSILGDFSKAENLTALEGAQDEVLTNMAKNDPANAAEYLKWTDHVAHPLNEYLVLKRRETPKIAGMYAVNAYQIGGQYAVQEVKAEAQQILADNKSIHVDLSTNFKGIRVVSTIQTDTQKKALTAVQSLGLKSGDPDIALIHEDQTGAVQAMIGGRGNNPATMYVNFATSPRQVGSSEKVFALANAIESGDSLNTVYPEPDSYVVPKANNGSDYTVTGQECPGTTCTNAMGLADSSNIWGIEVTVKYGIKRTMEIAKALGQTELNDTNPPMSSVFGTQNVSLEHLATSFFGLLGNNGQAITAHSVTSIEDTKDNYSMTYHATNGAQVVTPEVAQTVAEAAKGTAIYGTAAKTFTLAQRNPDGFASKTGTTSSNSDALFTVVTCKGVTSAREGYLEAAKPMPGKWGAGDPAMAAERFEEKMDQDPSCHLGLPKAAPTQPVAP